MAAEVRAEGADFALGFDGDGDRCGVVDNEGNEIFADKIGVMLARDLSALHPGAQFVVDVKSTGLFMTDPVLQAQGARTDYWKTGHSYIKRRVQELNALAGFEKSGHFFFNAPVGRGYDDGLVTAIAVCAMMERNPGATMADLYRALPKTWGSPTMSPHCADEVKYGVVDKVISRLTTMSALGQPIGGHAIANLVTVNGIRVTCDDGTWGLVRASSNKPELVVVVESPVSEARLHEMFRALDAILREITPSPANLYNIACTWALLGEKEAVARELDGALRTRAAELGVVVVSLGIRDVILPGEMKELMNRVIEAQKAAEAALVTRREETAAMRSQANTARLFEQNPTLMRLRELETLEKVAEKGRLSVVVGEGGLAGRIVKLV